MKTKIILNIALLLLILIPITNQVALAASYDICYDPLCDDGYVSHYTGYGEEEDPRVIVARVINVAFTLLGTLSLVIIIFAGFKWMWARGNEEQITQAKEMLKGTFIGLIIMFASYSIAYYIFYSLTRVTNVI